MNLCEALIYPTKEYYINKQRKQLNVAKIMNIIYNSKRSDWIVSKVRNKMVHSENPNLSIQWNINYDNTFNEEWATQHLDKNAYEKEYNVYYNKLIINSFSLVLVDGGRALLPMPKIGTNVIFRRDYQLALLFSEDEKNLNDYIKRSGLIVD